MEKLVLIPPMGHKSDFFALLIKELKDFEVITLEYPEIASNLNELADYFADLIRPLGTCSIVGLSLGATISYPIKEILGDQIKHIFAMATGGQKVARARKEMLLFAIENLSSEEMLNKILSLKEESFLEHFSNNQEKAKSYLETLGEHWFSKPPKNLIHQLTQALNVNYEEIMNTFQKNITVIWAENDRIFSQRHLKKLKKIMPEAQFVLLQNAGHYFPLEYPKQTAKVITCHEVFNI